MVINPNEKFLENYCNKNNLKYFAKPNYNNEIPLYLWSNSRNEFIEASFDISNITENRLKEIIDNHLYHHCWVF